MEGSLFSELLDWWSRTCERLAAIGPGWFRFLGFCAGLLFLLASLGVGTLNALTRSVTADMRLTGDLYALNRPQAVTFHDESGVLLGQRGAKVGDRLKLSEMPPYLPAAFLVMEDRRFRQHTGMDVWSVLRAAITNYDAGQIVQGGSTITQQLMKLMFLDPERTYERKLDELAGAIILESRLSKDEILELYLNRIYLGSGAYGVDGAARTYFGKSARRLTLSEAAMLAALTRAPSILSPKRNLALAQARANRVLDALVETGKFTEKQVAYTRAHPAIVTEPVQNVERNYFFDVAAGEAKRLAGGWSGDLIAIVTLDTAMQIQARDAVLEFIPDKNAGPEPAGEGMELDEEDVEARNARAQREALNANQAGLVAMEASGAVRALIGGRDYADSVFNRATQARRQPGSAFKPFVYLAALEHGLSPWTVRYDGPIRIENYTPHNYGGYRWGSVTLSYALAKSINTVAVGLGEEIGRDSVIDVARRLGIASPLTSHPSLALGASELSLIELTGAYGTFAAGGRRATPYTVSEVRTAAGKLLFKRSAGENEPIVEQNNVEAMNAMLYRAVNSGTGRAARIAGREIAGKTGTSQGFRDAWFVGYVPGFVTGVWVGNDDGTPMNRVTGGQVPARIWNRFMTPAIAGRPFEHLPGVDPEPEWDPRAYFAGNSPAAELQRQWIERVLGSLWFRSAEAEIVADEQSAYSGYYVADTRRQSPPPRPTMALTLRGGRWVTVPLRADYPAGD